MTPIVSASDTLEPGGPGDRLLSWRKVREITDLSRSTAWRRQKAGDFPLAVQISPGRVGWWESEVNRWKAARTHRSAAPPPRILSQPAPHVEAPPPPASTGEDVEPVNIPAAVPGRPERSSARRPHRSKTCEGQIAFEF
jgi:predicted DNA-binding transcriptional regulator AlpA